MEFLNQFFSFNSLGLSMVVNYFSIESQILGSWSSGRGKCSLMLIWETSVMSLYIPTICIVDLKLNSSSGGKADWEWRIHQNKEITSVFSETDLITPELYVEFLKAWLYKLFQYIILYNLKVLEDCIICQENSGSLNPLFLDILEFR